MILVTHFHKIPCLLEWIEFMRTTSLLGEEKTNGTPYLAPAIFRLWATL